MMFIHHAFLYLYPMISVISPAKTLDFSSDLKIGSAESPIFLDEASKVNRKLKSLTTNKLMSLLGISENLANQNFKRNQDWSAEDIHLGRQAVLAFKGDVYLGLEAENWSEEDMQFAQDRLYILSGLYGLLKVNSFILPYRLEMGTNLRKGGLEDLLQTKNLYQFWGNKITQYLNLEKSKYLINLASEEYFSAINSKELSAKIINIVFKEKKGDIYKIIGIHAKKARGLMVRFIIENNVKTIEELKGFNIDKYRFSEEMSSGNDLVFTR